MWFLSATTTVVYHYNLLVALSSQRKSDKNCARLMATLRWYNQAANNSTDRVWKVFHSDRCCRRALISLQSTTSANGKANAATSGCFYHARRTAKDQCAQHTLGTLTAKRADREANNVNRMWHRDAAFG